MTPPLHVLIIDDCALYAVAIAALLNAQQEIPVRCMPATPAEAIEKALSAPTEVVLVNALMERGQSLRLIQQIKEEIPGVKVVVIGLPHKDDVALEFIEAGATGYVFKEETLTELVRTIEGVRRNQAPRAPFIVASVFARINQLSAQQRQDKRLKNVVLTQREQDILSLIALGLSNKEIAGRFNLSLSTVKNHVHNILDKLKVHHRREAVKLTYENGWPVSFDVHRPSRDLSDLPSSHS